MVSKREKKYLDLIEEEFQIKIDREVLECLKKLAQTKFYNFGYLACLPTSNLFGTKDLNVLSWYIEPKQRNIKNFMKIQRDIKKLAKDSGCKYIKQYSHLNPEFNRWLEKTGYTVSEYKKEI